MTAKKKHNDRNPKYRFKKCDDPFEEAKEDAMQARKGQYRNGIPNTFAAQGLLGLRKYAEEWWIRNKRDGVLGPMFHTKALFMDWYGDNPRPGNCLLVRKDMKDKAMPHNVKYVMDEAYRTVVNLQKHQKHNYFGVVWDPGFKNHPGVWRGEFRMGERNFKRKGWIYREFGSEKQAARWVDYLLEKKYGVYCVLNRDIDRSLGHEDFDDIPVELYGGWNGAK